jgi:ABC-type multidrug transport system ATPase subunit
LYFALSDVSRNRFPSYKKFRNHIAVDDLSFSVNEGDVYGFLGQNGASKSTPIRMLLT